MARFLVTGATGHLGANLVRDLLAHGHEVVALARASSDRRGLVGTSAVIAEGDLRDRSSLDRAVAGCDAVVHAGAVHKNASRDGGELLDAAIEGTRHVVEAAAKASVKRLVHVSSNATIGYGQEDGVPLDEHSSMNNPVSPYIRGKVESERLAFELGKRLGIEVVVTNPCGILGPWDLRITPTTRAVMNMCVGAPAVVDVSLTHVADVASGCRLAWELGKPGERYLLAADLGTRQRVSAMMTGLVGHRIRPFRPPYAAVWAMAYAQEKRFEFGGPEPDITRAILHDLGRNGHLLYSSEKARRELGWVGRPLLDTLRDTVRWLAHTGRVPGELGATLRERLPADADWPR